MRRSLLALALVGWCALSAHAAGLYLYELGSPDVGLAAAGYAARAQDASTAFTNPAGMTRLEGTELMLGPQALRTVVEFNPNDGTTTTGDDGDGGAWLPTGGLFVTHKVTPNLAVGLSGFGFFGNTLDYGNDWVGRYYVTKIVLQGMSLSPAVGYRVNDWLSVGASAILSYMTFEQRLNVNLLGPEDGELRVRDDDWVLAGKFGVLVEPRRGTRFGLTYLTKADLDFKDAPQFRGMEGTLLLGILEQAGIVGAKLDLGMTAPQAVMLSGYHEVTERLALLANVGWEEWSAFGKVDVAVNTNGGEASVTADRNYNDTWHAALGAQYRISEPWLLSLGVAYDTSMVDDADRTPDLPVGASWRFGTGCQWKQSERLTIGGAYAVAYAGDLDMEVERGPLSGKVSGKYDGAALHFLSLNLDWRF